MVSTWERAEKKELRSGRRGGWVVPLDVEVELAGILCSTGGDCHLVDAIAGFGIAYFRIETF